MFDHRFGKLITATAKGTLKRSERIGMATTGAPAPTAPLTIPPTPTARRAKTSSVVVIRASLSAGIGPRRGAGRSVSVFGVVLGYLVYRKQIIPEGMAL
jgi:hypothetical protein